MIKILLLLMLHIFSCTFQSKNEGASKLKLEEPKEIFDSEPSTKIQSDNESKLPLLSDKPKLETNSRVVTPANRATTSDTDMQNGDPALQKPILKQDSEEATSETVSENKEKMENNPEPIIELLDEKPIMKDLIIDHSSFDILLKKHVHNGKVDYRSFKNDATLLNDYTAYLTNNPPNKSHKRNEKLAYWINAYNAFTIKLILENYPLKSIIDLHGGNPWDIKWIHIGERKLSLNNIENDIIRPEFKEPRIHFAVNCAAKSCPPLASTAFTAENLNDLLEERTRKFINDPSYNIIKKSSIKISKIFDWYKEDFVDLVAFIDKYSNIDISKNAKVSFSEYDWSLNTQ